MSKNLNQLLNKGRMSINGFIETAEEFSGYPSEDVRLTSDLAAIARSTLGQLNLDPADTTAGELYHALLIEYERASYNFAIQIGQKATDPIASRLKKVARIIAHAHTSRQVWALKKSVAKELLKNHQPKKLMKELHYRSLDSMLKRENIALIYAALSYTESPRWLKIMQKSYASLSSKDFETRDLELIVAPARRWAAVAAKAGPLSSVNKLGVVVLWPNQTASQIPSLTLSMIGLQAIGKMRAKSAWLKLQQFNPDFGRLFVKDLQANSDGYISAAGQLIPWRAVARVFASYPESDFPEIFQPHVLRSDMDQHTPLDLLFKLSPQLYLWRNCGHLIFSDASGHSVSCNLIDVAMNHAANKPLNKRFLVAGRQRLEEELVGRYMSHPGFEAYILRAIEQNMNGGEDDFSHVVNFSKLGAAASRQVTVA